MGTSNSGFKEPYRKLTLEWLKRNQRRRTKSAIVRKKEASRSEIVKLLWDYLKKNNLQDQEMKQWFTPDKKMAKVFGKDKLKGFSMMKFLNPHLKDIAA